MLRRCHQAVQVLLLLVPGGAVLGGVAALRCGWVSGPASNPSRALLAAGSPQAGKSDAADSVRRCVVRVISSASASALRSTGVVADCRRLSSLTW